MKRENLIGSINQSCNGNLLTICPNRNWLSLRKEQFLKILPALSGRFSCSSLPTFNSSIFFSSLVMSSLQVLSTSTCFFKLSRPSLKSSRHLMYARVSCRILASNFRTSFVGKSDSTKLTNASIDAVETPRA